MQNLIYFFIGISLSIDAFTVALAMGTNIISKKHSILLTITIGVFHFFMPILGNIFGLFLSKKIITNTNIICSIIFFYLALELKFDDKKQNIITKINAIIIIIIALTVSIDSLSVGFVIGLNNEPILLASTIFMLLSTAFTNFGLFIGQKIKSKYQVISIYLGKILLIVTAIKYLIG